MTFFNAVYLKLPFDDGTMSFSETLFLPSARGVRHIYLLGGNVILEGIIGYLNKEHKRI